jgi:hypothetical protein
MNEQAFEAILFPPRARVNPKRKTPRKGHVYDPAYLAWQAMQPCCVTGIWPATTHHVRFCGSPKDDTRTIRLIKSLHQLVAAKPGTPCIEQGKKQFEEFHGIDIEAEIKKSRERYERGE